MPAKKPPLALQTYQSLLEEILAGKRVAGKKISEESICAEFGISRTPAREALMRLAADGLVERTARRGCRIRPIDREQQRDLFTCRAQLETLALDLGFDRIPIARVRQIMVALNEAQRQNDHRASLAADYEFHHLIATSCPNRTLGGIIERLLRECAAARAMRTVSTRLPTLTSERQGVLRAILQKQPAVARKLLQEHIMKGLPE